MEVVDHWLNIARRKPSPNFNERPEETISLLVLHNISLPPGKFGGTYIEDLFLNQLDPEVHPYFREIHTLKVSSHLLIDRTGTVTQFVPFNKRAWHAGQSEYARRTDCNDFSIGIELEGTDTDLYTDIQYRVLADVTAALHNAYKDIIPSSVTGHEFIAPGRKTDPGASFDWSRYFSSITEISGSGL